MYFLVNFNIYFESEMLLPGLQSADMRLIGLDSPHCLPLPIHVEPTLIAPIVVSQISIPESLPESWD